MQLVGCSKSGKGEASKMSNVYILPRNKTRTVVVGGSTNNRALPRAFPAAQRAPGRLIRGTAIRGNNKTTRMMMQQQQHQRMPIGTTTATNHRRVLLAPATAPLAVFPATAAVRHQPLPPTGVGVQQRQLAPSTAATSKISPQSVAVHRLLPQQQRTPVVFNVGGRPEQSEEDDEPLDVDEVYQLLEESAGHRMQPELLGAAPKRRERLTNLTQEEKMNRRKQKNRVAAQAGRDRKKETTKRLEDSLRKALLQIGRLRDEVKMLRAENIRLIDENQAVRNFGQQQKTKQEMTTGATVTGMAPLHMHHYYQSEPAAYDQRGMPMQQSQQHFDDHAEMKQQQFEEEQQQQHLLSDDQESVRSAASFSDPQQWERDTQLSAQEEEELLPNNNTYNCCSNNDNSSDTVKMRKLRMACVVKVLMALWSMLGTKQKNQNSSSTTPTTTTLPTMQTLPMMTSNCNKSLMNCLKNWTFQSMWTASATRSLRRALLRRMLRMDSGKLVRLCNSPQLVALLQRQRKSAEACRKARGRLRTTTAFGSMRTTTTAPSMLAFTHTTTATAAAMETAESNNSQSSEQEEDMASSFGIVPQLKRH